MKSEKDSNSGEVYQERERKEKKDKKDKKDKKSKKDRKERSRSRSRSRKEKKDRKERRIGTKWGEKIQINQPEQLHNSGVDLFETGAIKIGVDGSCLNIDEMAAPEQVLQNSQKNLFNKFFKEQEMKVNQNE